MKATASQSSALNAISAHTGGSSVSVAHAARAASGSSSLGTNRVTSSTADSTRAIRKFRQARVNSTAGPPTPPPITRRRSASRAGSAPSSRSIGSIAARNGLNRRQVRWPSIGFQPQCSCARRVSAVPGTLPNTARDSTYCGMRSNTGRSHHISTHASQIWPTAHAARFSRTNTAPVTRSHGVQIAAACRRTRAAPSSIASHDERGRNSTVRVSSFTRRAPPTRRAAPQRPGVARPRRALRLARPAPASSG